MEGKVVIVTGGNSGIGLATVRGLAKLGATVVMACRDMTKARHVRDAIVKETGNPRLEVMALDLGSSASIKRFAAEFLAAHTQLHVLINNAGTWERTRSVTADGFETTFGANHLGVFLLTHELLGVLKATAPSRIVNVASKLHYRGHMDWGDLMAERKFSATTAYNQSKLANVLFTRQLAQNLKGTGVTVNCLHPGVVATDLTRHYPKILVKLFHLFLITPEEGASTSLYLATSKDVEGVTGEYFDKSRKTAPSAEARDPSVQKRLWEVSEHLLKLDGLAAA